jgi:hypothetical protein
MVRDSKIRRGRLSMSGRLSYNLLAGQKKTARKRPKSREETPKEGMRRSLVACPTYIAPHKMQWAKAQIGGKSAVVDDLCARVIFLHHIIDASQTPICVVSPIAWAHAS